MAPSFWVLRSLLPSGDDVKGDLAICIFIFLKSLAWLRPGAWTIHEAVEMRPSAKEAVGPVNCPRPGLFAQHEHSGRPAQVLKHQWLTEKQSNDEVEETSKQEAPSAAQLVRCQAPCRARYRPLVNT